SGLEENKAVVLEDRDLTERLESAVLRFVLISLLEQARVVRQTGFLQSPAHAQIAYMAFGNVRNPFERGYRDHFVCSSIELHATSKWRMSLSGARADRSQRVERLTSKSIRLWPGRRSLALSSLAHSLHQ